MSVLDLNTPSLRMQACTHTVDTHICAHTYTYKHKRSLDPLISGVKFLYHVEWSTHPPHKHTKKGNTAKPTTQKIQVFEVFSLTVCEN